jgi:hypothetical protein
MTGPTPKSVRRDEVEFFRHGDEGPYEALIPLMIPFRIGRNLTPPCLLAGERTVPRSGSPSS